MIVRQNTIWLKSFHNLPGYEQIDIQETILYAVDIMIFDDRVVVLHRPEWVYGDNFHHAVMTDNEKIARLFQNGFIRMETRCPLRKCQSSAPPL